MRTMRKIICLLLCFVIMLSLCGCSLFSNELFGTDIYTMSTVATLYIPKNTKNSDEVILNAKTLIYGIENEMSINVKTSDVSKFNQSETGTKDVKTDTSAVMKTAVDVAKKTDGAFNPCMGALTTLWNITGENPTVPYEGELIEAMKHIDYTKMTVGETELTKTDSQLKIDAGGIAKGYALQKTVEYLSKFAKYGTVSFGGNVGVFGQKPDGTVWKVGIKDPNDTGKEVGYIEMTEGYVAVSGDYERYFEEDGVKYHHILDPKTGYPTDNGVHSVAVYCKDATLGDALSTALFVMGYEKGMELYHSGEYDFEALFITDDGIFQTDNLNFNGATN